MDGVFCIIDTRFSATNADSTRQQCVSVLGSDICVHGDEAMVPVTRSTALAVLRRIFKRSPTPTYVQALRSVIDET